MKKALSIAGISLGFLLVLLVTLPILFQGRIREYVLRQANERLSADVSVGRVGVSVIRSFPRLTVRVEDLVLTNREPFEGRELARLGEVVVRVDLFSALSGRTVTVRGVDIRDARLDLVVAEDGTLNYAVFGAPGESRADQDGGGDRDDADGGFQLILSRYSLERLDLEFQDLRTGFSARAEGVRHEGRGTFGRGPVELSTRTAVDSLSVESAGVPLLQNVRVLGETDLTFEPAARRFTLQRNELFLNDLALVAEGWTVAEGLTTEMDLRFRAPDQDLKALLSVVPGFYTRDFDALQASGTFGVEGQVRGRRELFSELLPGFDVRTTISDGNIQYRGVPTALEAVHAELVLRHPDQTPLDATTVEIPRMGARISDGALAGHLFVASPVSDPAVRLFAEADLDLALLSQALNRPEGVQGRVAGELRLEGRRSDFEALRTDRTVVEGTVRLDSVLVSKDEWTHPLSIPALQATLSPGRIGLSRVSLGIGGSDLQGSGHLLNPIAFRLGSAKLEGDMQVRSGLLDLDELHAWAAAAQPVEEDAEAAGPRAVTIPPDVNLRLLFQAQGVRYGTLALNGLSGRVVVAEGTLNLEDVTASTLGGRLALRGSYSAPPGATPQLSMTVDMAEMPFASAFQEIRLFSSFAPILRKATGTFSSGLRMTAALQPDLRPVLGTVGAEGVLTTSNLALQTPETGQLATLLGLPGLSEFRALDSRARFNVQDGRMTLQPIRLRWGGQEATFSGSSGLDRTLDYRLGATLPASRIRLPAELVARGITTEDVPVEVRISGTFGEPSFTTSFGGLQARALEAVTEAVDAERAARVQAAEIRGDSLIAQARREADRIRAEAQVQADTLRAEARARADQAIAEARGNPVAQVAARALADRILAEVDRQVNALLAEADRRAEQVIRAAEEEKEALVRTARGGP